ncbi:MAG: HAD hydrolase-like protein [Firmicutes bacterium]|nr:HAD hydrolase-like protein [Bacillota bacterium]
MLQNIKAIFLDLGGTFREVNEDRAYSLAARKRIAEILCPAADPDSYYEYINKKYDVYREWALHWTCEAPEEELWCRWLVPELPREAVAPHAKELTYCFRAAKGRRLVVPHGIETVRELRNRGYLVGIISDLVGTLEIDEWLDADGIRDLFCTVKQSSVTMLRKPHPAIYYQALAEAGVLPADSVFVGDNLQRDILGAKATGFAGTIGVDYPATAPLKITAENRPDGFIHDFADLLAIFPGNAVYLPEQASQEAKTK